MDQGSVHCRTELPGETSHAGEALACVPLFRLNKNSGRMGHSRSRQTALRASKNRKNISKLVAGVEKRA
jgi:hypothetical protein